MELADLLLVRHHYRHGDVRPEGRALLLRARGSTTPRTGRLTTATPPPVRPACISWSTPIAFPNGDFGPPPSGDKWVIMGQGPSLPDTRLQRLRHRLEPTLVPRAEVSRQLPVGRRQRVAARGRPRPRGARHAEPRVGVGGLRRRARHGRPWHIAADAADHWSHFVLRGIRALVAVGTPGAARGRRRPAQEARRAVVRAVLPGRGGQR